MCHITVTVIAAVLPLYVADTVTGPILNVERTGRPLRVVNDTSCESEGVASLRHISTREVWALRQREELMSSSDRRSDR